MCLHGAFFRRLDILTDEEMAGLLERCDQVSRKIVSYAKTLKDA